MTPVIHCSAGNIHYFPRATFVQRKEIQLIKHNVSGNCTRLASSRPRFPLHPSSLRLFQICRSGFPSNYGSRIQSIAAVGTDVAVETSPAVSNEDPEKTIGAPTDSTEAKESTPTNPSVTSAKTKRSRPARKSEMPPVKDEDLVPGVSFTGKVRSIQPFGAFVDFGAFTDGLVHVSRMSDGYVKDVGSIVSVGQEVSVRIVEANMETGRISLTMRDNDNARKIPQRRENPASGSSDKQRPSGKGSPRSAQKRDEERKKSKFEKGQALNGTVKNTTRSGSFVSLPDGEEGFIPVSEESEGYGNIPGNSTLQVGQEVNVRVLRITRGRVTLTMKKEENVEELNRQLNKGVWHAATNPFEMAFRQNKDIASFLDEREKAQRSSEKTSLPKESEEIEDNVGDIITRSDSLIVDNSATSGELLVETTSAESSSTELVSGEEPVRNSQQGGISIPETMSEDSDSSSGSSPDSDLADAPILSDTKESNAAVDTVEEQTNSSDSLFLENNESAASLATDAESITNDEEIEDNVEDIITRSDSLIVDNSATSGELLVETTSAESSSTELVSGEEPVRNLQQGGIAIPETMSEDSDSSSGSSPDSDLAAAPILSDTKESNAAVDTVEEQTNSSDSLLENNESAASLVTDAESITNDKVNEENNEAKLAEGSEEDSQVEAPIVEEVIVTDQIKITDVEKAIVLDEEVGSKENGGSADPATGDDPAGEFGEQILSQVQDPEAGNVTQADATLVKGKLETETPTVADDKAAISPALVKQLREETGAGMMDCKKALSETGGDIIKAQEFLRTKGLASADKKASRATAEGRVGSYIHDSRIGVLIEVNCETDFVSRGEIFKQLVDDLAMQVAASPQVCYVVTEDVPEEFVNKEREIEMQREDLLSKPENIRSKIVDGRIRKRLEEFALLEQPYIKNDKMVVKDHVKQTIATIGENIKVRRFVRYNLGEGLEKKSQDFAAEVAAQTVAKEPPAAPKDQHVESGETTEKPPAVAVSAALVKQLREETGAGMMDCKKALTETGGDIEKAQEYLRKKGLLSADKKSSRLAAEGRISAYIHDARIGCLVEVNSETDFAARNEKFKELVDDLAMQVVACPQVEYVSVEDIPEDIVNKEKEIEMQREDLKSKPENIREKIVEGRISKRLGELALLDQPFIRDDKVLVKDLVKQTVAALGENIRVRRFVRYTLGESKD